MSLKNKIKSLFETGEEYVEVDVPTDGLRDEKDSQTVVNLTRLQEATTKMILCEPRSYSEAQEIADHIINRRSVVINLQQLEHEQAKRIIDFMSGTVYALNGQIQKLGTETFLCTPDNVDVSGSISDTVSEEVEFNRGW
ncbi:cell division inhibitor SepF [Cerasibacillus quisquiliarum]|uniref:Cell division protein SepF n=1 Tax=Cerasibacillus quisquiliarum TaxID=227865 RepID=A0A511UUV3_9BACI|nr:cell division protein SepF [Cerasibacillus quisquiliarum]MBB5145783.1 cell division inhibitor SepF [Cerasibacillus quisquiliarum]GEN30354.1 cell division protein SepF [Cerasibacillus quisquiliarum]